VAAAHDDERLAWIDAELRAWNGTLVCTAPSTSPQFVLGRSLLGVTMELVPVDERKTRRAIA
jgi:hypothetical protein